MFSFGKDSSSIKDKLSRAEKSPDQLSSRLNTTRERFKRQRLRVEVELNNYAGFFRGGFVFPLNHSSHHSLYQHRVSTQDFHVFYSAIGRDQQFHTGASADIVPSGQIRIDRLYAIFNFARDSLRKGRLVRH